MPNTPKIKNLKNQELISNAKMMYVGATGQMSIKTIK
jgi:hypothetical protein